MEEQERREVLTELQDALKVFSSNERSYLLIPEVRTNLGYAVNGAKNVFDVAAVPGRVSVAFQRILYCLPPAFGASDHIARVILTAMEFDQRMRSAMNVIFHPKFLTLNPYVFDRASESTSDKQVERRTMNFMVRKAFEETGAIPELIVDKGDFGKEPGTFILGRNPKEVVERAFHLLSLIEER
ncbi:phosphomethylpyrimidine kinase [Metallosphaera tengchongensis]|uniref:Phosphomethylpyrimidine kinase n=1 Tax=Metallosphaera tengchongensis TaxID=1532350 RepID=A0A6N0NU89_9CREN|nr:thiamine-phosphate synthase family protein [Metallosphaera tengchongensis]QKR00356.1 phosphomethylpyrimidine kinase [Metallosphaera tengchongensis]